MPLLFAVSIVGYDQWNHATKDKIFRVYSAMVMLFLKILEGKVKIHTLREIFLFQWSPKAPLQSAMIFICLDTATHPDASL